MRYSVDNENKRYVLKSVSVSFNIRLQNVHVCMYVENMNSVRGFQIVYKIFVKNTLSLGSNLSVNLNDCQIVIIKLQNLAFRIARTKRK